MSRRCDVLWVLCGLVLATAASGPNAAGGTLRVGGGSVGGEYGHFAEATCDALGSLFSCAPVETGGSPDNIARLKLPSTDPRAVDIAFVQGDVADHFQQEPGFHDQFVVVRGIVGEAVLLFMTQDTAKSVKNWSGIKELAFLLSMGVPDGQAGDATVFNALRALPGSPLQAMEIRQYQGRPPLFDAVRSGEVRIGWLVQYPNPDNVLFKEIAQAGLVVMGVDDPDFANLGGSFAVQDVTAANTCVLWVCWPAKPIHTTTIKAAMVARAPMTYADPHARDVQRSAIHAIQQAREPDLLPQPSFFTALVNFLWRIFG